MPDNAQFQTIGVIGAGAWGTALAYSTQAAGRDVRIWAREPDVAEALRTGAGNPTFLAGTELPAMPASTDIGEMAGCDVLLSVVPAQFTRTVLADLKPYMDDGTPLLLCAKGIEQSTLSLMTDVLAETLPNAVPGVLSGPSFAIDVARGLPTAVTLACEDEALGDALMATLGRPEFRPYWSNDLIGAEVGGAVKNVLAIACGMVEGLGLGKSAHAALMTRGFAEMTRLTIAMGGRADTVAGLCGLGDLVLTCSSPQSRNMSFGKALGEGRRAEDVLAERRAVTEGAATAPALLQLARQNETEMPICEAISNILSGAITVGEAMEGLLSRPFKEET